jgi:hypothetical protein
MPSPGGDCICAGQRRTRRPGPQFTAGEPEHGRPVRSQHNPCAGDPAGSYAGLQHAPREAGAPSLRRTGGAPYTELRTRSLCRPGARSPAGTPGAPRRRNLRAPSAGSRKQLAAPDPGTPLYYASAPGRSPFLVSAQVAGALLRGWRPPAGTSSGIGAAARRPGLPSRARSPWPAPGHASQLAGRLRQPPIRHASPGHAVLPGSRRRDRARRSAQVHARNPHFPDRFRRPPTPKVTWITGAKAGSGARTRASSPAPGRRPDAAGRGPRPDRDHLAPGTPARAAPRARIGSAAAPFSPSQRAVQTQPLPFRNLCGPSGGGSGGRWSRRPLGGVRPPGPSFAVPQSWRLAAH